MGLSKYWFVVSRVTLYKVSSDSSEEFWSWLYRRVVDQTSVDHARPLFVMYLLSDAIDKGEFVRVTDIYEKFAEIVDQYSSPELIAEIKSSQTAARNREKLSTDTGK